MEIKGRVISNDTRKLLWANTTYYVRTDGNDSNDGSANDAAHAFLTIQHAIDIYQALDCNGYDVTIQVADGTYTAEVTITNRVGLGNLYITGNAGTPSNVIWSVSSPTNADIFISGHPAGSYVIISGFKFSTTSSGSAIYANGGSRVKFTSVEFGAVPDTHVKAGPGARIECTGNYTVSGGGNAHITAFGGGFVIVNSKTVTISGTPAFTFFVNVYYCGILESISDTWNGSATGSKGTVWTNGVINTGGAGYNYFPGNASFVTATGGQYL